MNSVKFYLFKIKKFIIFWVVFMYYLIFLGKEFFLGEICGEGGLFNV